MSQRHFDWDKQITIEMESIRPRIEESIKYMCEGVYEKKHIMSKALLCAIAGESIFLLGPPGTAKSLVARRLKMIFKDGESFEYLMSRFSTPDEIFGPVSISKLKNEDIYERKVDGYLPSAHIVFLDEIWKAGPAIQNALLTAVNEHIFQNGQHTLLLPMKALIAASNELPAEDEGLEALWDRFLVRVVSNPIEKESTFFKMVKQRTQPNVAIPDRLKITDSDYVEWQKAIDDIEITDEVCAVVSAIRKALKEESAEDDTLPLDYYVSDRRWKKLFHLMRASAFLNGRRKTDYSDCLLLYHCLWNKDKCIPVILKIVKQSISADIRKRIEQLQKETDKYISSVSETKQTKAEANISEFLVVDLFYYLVDHYPEGRCLCSFSEYSHCIGTESSQGYIYYDSKRQAFIVRSLGKNMNVPVKNQSDIRIVELKRIPSGIMIDGTPYLFIRQKDEQPTEPPKNHTSKANINTIDGIVNALEQDVKPKMELLSRCLTSDYNLFVSPEDLKITKTAVAETENLLQEFCIKVSNSQRL